MTKLSKILLALLLLQCSLVGLALLTYADSSALEIVANLNCLIAATFSLTYIILLISE